jgi:hypothetical protein
MSEQPEKNIPIKSYHKWELAVLYDVGVKQFDAWIEPHKDKIGEQIGKKYTPKQVRIIFECLDPP